MRPKRASVFRRLAVLGLLALALAAVPGSAAADSDPTCGSGGTFNITGNTVTSSTWDCAGAIIVPSPVTTIDHGAFQNKNITTVSLPSTVTDIGTYAFAGSGVTTITIPAGVSDLQEGVFFYATSLTSVSFAVGSSLTNIGPSAFGNTTSLTAITLPSTLLTIERFAFRDTGLISLNIPASVTGISNGAFRGAIGMTAFVVVAGNSYYHADSAGVLFDTNSHVLQQYPLGRLATSYAVPADVVTVGENSFQNAQFLETITFVAPSSTTDIGMYAFANSRVTTITIPAGVSDLQERVFGNASNLTSVSFAVGSLLTNIGNSAFAGTSSLAAITLPSTLLSIDDYAFANTGLTSLNIPASVNDIQNNAFRDATGMTAFVVAAGNSYYRADSEGVLFDTQGDGPVLQQYPLGRLATSYAVPADVVTVGENSFRNAQFLETITFVAPSSTTEIGYYAFRNTPALLSVVFPNSVTQIKSESFDGSNVSSVTLPNMLTVVEDSVFFDSHITTLTLPASVTVIEDSALSTSTLTDLWFLGNMTAPADTSSDAFYRADRVRVHALATSDFDFTSPTSTAPQWVYDGSATQPLYL